MEVDEVFQSRTELDSHANMPVVGRYATIIATTDQTVEVNPFTPDYAPLKVPLVDAAIKYDCPYTGKSCLIIIRNALHVPSMANNLIPPFIMREAGVIVNDVPKIHVDEPTIEDHAIIFPANKFNLPLALWGVFSYFLSSKPTIDECNNIDDVYVITPDKWNPHCTSYSDNEENMLDWEGNMVEKRDRVRILMSDIPTDPTASVASVSQAETTCIDENCSQQEKLNHEQKEDSKIERNTELADISAIYDAPTLWAQLSKRSKLSEQMIAAGSTNARLSKYILEEPSDFDLSEIKQQAQQDLQDDPIIQVASLDPATGELDLDSIFVSATAARLKNDIDAQHLAKVWKIDLDSAKQTLEVTSQHCSRQSNQHLSRNYSTNDRMLRYKRINEYFYMDTFFATAKSGTSSRKHTCCQLFVTDKGFIYVVLMKSKSEVLQAVKQFAKEIGAPDALISDSAAEQKSHALKKFCNQMDTTLRLLEEGTPWANRAELYIGLIKEAVRQDMKDTDCPIAFWDYCLVRRVRINNLTAKNLFQLHRTNAYTAMLGTEGDISNLACYGFYEWVYF